MRQGMQRLVDLTGDLSSKHDVHAKLLHQAKGMTNEILETLHETAASAAIVEEALSKKSPVASLWPYIWCPAASLVMGSYGLPPSVVRNMVLVVLGTFHHIDLSPRMCLIFPQARQQATLFLQSACCQSTSSQ